jgi:hypothetical protein
VATLIATGLVLLVGVVLNLVSSRRRAGAGPAAEADPAAAGCEPR